MSLRLDVRHPLLQLGENSGFSSTCVRLNGWLKPWTINCGLGGFRHPSRSSTTWAVTRSAPSSTGFRALAIATALGNSPLQVELNFRLGQVYHQIGQYRVAMNFLSRNVENVELLQGELAHKLIAPISFSVFSRAYLLLRFSPSVGNSPRGLPAEKKRYRFPRRLIKTIQCGNRPLWSRSALPAGAGGSEPGHAPAPTQPQRLAEHAQQ